MNQHARALLCAIRRGRVRMEVHMNRDLTQWEPEMMKQFMAHRMDHRYGNVGLLLPEGTVVFSGTF